MRAPASGCSPAYLRRSDIRPGISCSASSISLRPYSARERSATLKSWLVAVVVVTLGASVMGVDVWFGAGSGGFGELQEALMLLLLPAQPVALPDAFGPLRRGLGAALDPLAQPPAAAPPPGKPYTAEGAVRTGPQLGPGAQALRP